jgi:hypothetical protein
MKMYWLYDTKKDAIGVCVAIQSFRTPRPAPDFAGAFKAYPSVE